MRLNRSAQGALMSRIDADLEDERSRTRAGFTATEPEEPPTKRGRPTKGKSAEVATKDAKKSATEVKAQEGEQGTQLRTVL